MLHPHQARPCYQEYPSRHLRTALRIGRAVLEAVVIIGFSWCVIIAAIAIGNS